MSTDTAEARDRARATRSILKGAGAHLAGRKRGADRRVRRNSFDVADSRAQMWRPINGGGKRAGMMWKDTLLKVAREYDNAGKQKGRWAPLGPFTRDVLAALLDLVDFKTGRLDPTYAKLMTMGEEQRACHTPPASLMRRLSHSSKLATALFTE